MADTKEEIRVKYRGFIIRYWEHSDKWLVIVEETLQQACSREKLSEAKEYIDKTLKSQFQRVPVLLLPFRFDPCRVPAAVCEAEVTSVTDDGAVWITRKTGRRSIERSEVYLDTPENRAIAEEYLRLSFAAKHAEQVCKDQKKKLVPFPMLGADF